MLTTDNFGNGQLDKASFISSSIV